MNALPGMLDIYLTRRCNLDCRYCASRGLRARRGAPLSLGAVLRAVDLYASSARRAAAGVNFTGGEPLLAYDVLLAAADRIRRKHPRMEVTVSTNGTLLDPGKAASLLKRGVHVAVSLDGGAAVNDRRRRFARDADASVFDAVLDRLLRLPKERLRRMDVELTVSAADLPSLDDAAARLSAIGFRCVGVNFDSFEVWTPAKLAALRGALSALRHSPLLRTRRGHGLYFESHPSDDPRAQLSRALAFSPDGRFFACNAACVQDLADFQVGDLERGIDVSRLRRIYDAALAALPKGHAQSVYQYLDRYCHALVMGRDPAAMVEGGCRAGRILARGLEDLRAAQRVLERLAQDPFFGDFDHEPARRSEKALASIRLPVGSGLARELAGLRRAADFCLYSPGRDKRILLVPADPEASLPTLEGIALYALLKAEALKKRLRLRIRADARSLPGFLKGHGL
jgi:uncharacterized Fe-S cluster-containing radical SAM superfamily protein